MKRLVLILLAMSLAGCGRMYEQEGLIRWPDGTCAWPCIGGGADVIVTGYTFDMGGGLTYSHYNVSE